MGKLAFSSANPLYQQLMDDIKLDISNQKYRHGDKIPSETELAEIYNVSRITVRRAVSELCDEGYLAKHQGKGTFVQANMVERNLLHLGSYHARHSCTQFYCYLRHERDAARRADGGYPYCPFPSGGAAFSQTAQRQQRYLPPAYPNC